MVNNRTFLIRHSAKCGQSPNFFWFGDCQEWHISTLHIKANVTKSVVQTNISQTSQYSDM